MKKYIIIIISILSVNLNLYAQIDRSKPPAAGPAPEIKIGDSENFELKNGLKVIVVENHKIPRVAFNLVLDIEAVSEGDKAGYVSMAGELLRTGTTAKTKGEIDEEVDFIGATLNTSSTGIFASSLTKHSEKLLELMTDVLYNPSFTEAEFEKAKKQMQSSLDAEKDDPGSISSNVRSVLLYGKDHPYGEIVTEESLANITLEDCRAYYNTYFSPKIAYLVIVGDITLKEAKKTAKKYFGKWEPKDVELETFESVEGPSATEVDLVDRSNAVQSNISITYPINLKKGAEDEVKMRVFNQIFGAAPDSRLEEQIREVKAYTYFARATYSTDMIVGNFRAFTEVRNEVTDSAIYEFFKEFDKIINEPVSEAELKKAKAQITGSFARAMESPQTIANFALNIQRYNLPEDYYKNYLKKVDAVTVEDVQAMAKKYLKPENAYIVVVGKASEIADDLSQFGNVVYLDNYGNEYVPETTSLPEGLTATEVINNYLSAIGGEENARAIKDMSMLMKTEMQGRALEISVQSKTPNMSKTTVTMGGMTVMSSVFNGEEAMVQQMGQAVPVDENQKKDMAFEAAIISELAVKDMDLQTELLGVEKVEGVNAYAVAVTKPSGAKTTYFYDTETGLKLRTSAVLQGPQGEMVQDTDLSDYKPVGGVKFPHSISLPMGPMKMNAVTETIEVNKDIPDSEFAIE